MLKYKDLELIANLRQNCKENMTKVSERLDMPASTVYEKINNHDGIIKRFTCLVDFKRLGYGTLAMLIMKIVPKQKEALIAFLNEHPHVNSLLKVNNGLDLMAQVVFRTMADVEFFKDDLRRKFTMKKVDVHYVLDTINHESFLCGSIGTDLRTTGESAAML